MFAFRVQNLALGLLLLLQLPTTRSVFSDETNAAAERPQPIQVERDVLVRSISGTTVKADVFRPADDQVYPLVLMIHGGAWATGDKWNLINHAHELAHAGFVAVSINYRLAPVHRYPAQIEDCRYALKWAKDEAKRWNADPDRVAVWGYSAGAQLAGLLAADPKPDQPKLWAAVLGGAPCEFSFVPEESRVLAPVMGGSRQELPEVYRNASPLEFASKDVCPTFFFHGTNDLIVPNSSSKLMFEKLQDLKVESEYFTVEGQGHLLTFFNTEARQLAIEFLKKHLPAPH